MSQQVVYFARCISPWGTPMGAVKVGCSNGHDVRLKAIEQNQPYSLDLLATVPGGFIAEATVHLYLQKHRIAGEFFHENRYVAKFIDEVAARGAAFHWIDISHQGDYLTDGALDGFLQYHGITIDQVCESVGRSARSAKVSRHLVAAAILYARWAGNHGYGRTVMWPGDCIRGLLGETHPYVRPLLEAA